MTKTLLTLAAILGSLAAPAVADHANPWASDTDTVLSKNHDTNQARSADTPGEDEMRGAMKQTAHGKLDGVAGGAGGAKAAKGGAQRGKK
jgi:hypothetical protein